MVSVLVVADWIPAWKSVYRPNPWRYPLILVSECVIQYESARERRYNIYGLATWTSNRAESLNLFVIPCDVFDLLTSGYAAHRRNTVGNTFLPRL